MSARRFGGGNLVGGRLYPWLVAGVGVLAASPEAWGFEPTRYLNFSYGALSLRPKVNLSEAFTDNAYFQADGALKQSDLVSTFGAGFALTLGSRPNSDPYNVLGDGGGRNYWGLDYSYGRNMYLDNTDLDGDSHNVASSFRLQGNRLALTGNDRIEMTTSVLGGGINQGRKTTRDTYEDVYRLSYDVSTRTSAYLIGTHTTTAYAKGTPLYDMNTLNGAVGFAWRGLPKTTFFGESSYGQSAVDPNASSTPKGPHLTALGGFLGARGNFTQRIAGSVKVGYETREFSDGSQAEDSPVVAMAVSYRIGEKTRALLNYARTGSVSVQSPGESVTYDSVGVRMSHSFGSSSRWLSDFGANCVLGAFGSGGRRYAGRSDLQYRLNASLTYMIRLWMGVSLAYEYEDFVTNAEAQGIFDYSANRVTIRFSVGY